MARANRFCGSPSRRTVLSPLSALSRRAYARSRAYPLAEFHIQIEATIQAQNFESAQKKCADLQEKVARVAEATEVKLKGKP